MLGGCTLKVMNIAIPVVLPPQIFMGQSFSLFQTDCSAYAIRVFVS